MAASKITKTTKLVQANSASTQFLILQPSIHLLFVFTPTLTATEMPTNHFPSGHGSGQPFSIVPVMVDPGGRQR